MKKLTSILCAAALTAALIPTAFAAEPSNEVITDLHKFRIVADVNDIRPNDNVTRAEAVKMLCIAKGNDFWDGTETENSLFSDVPTTHWAAKYIEIGVNDEIINGYTDNTFKPENNVTNQELQKMIVCTLGYDIWCKAYGEYPKSYLYYSNLLQIPKGLTLNDEAYATRADAMQMIYNALDAPVLDTREYEYNEDRTTTTPIVKMCDGKDGNPLITYRKILSGEVEW